MDKKASQNPHLKPKNQAKKQKNQSKVLKIQNKNEKIQAKGKNRKGEFELKADESENLQPKMTPKFLARQEKIKKVALNLFLTQGYEETSLKEIIKKSGGSFSDIYSTFKNKEGLFVGVINDILTAKREIYSKILNKNLPLREFLYEFSTSVMRMFLQKRALRLVRIIYSQLYKQSNRALIEHFKQNKENIPEQTLVKYFANCPPPLCDEAQRYAELFFTMLKGKCLEEAFFFDKPLMSKKGQAEHCEFVVNFFIKALSAQANLRH